MGWPELRNRVLADDRVRIDAATRELVETLNKSHADFVCEAIWRVVMAIEVARLDCRLVNKHSPELPPITNDDLADLLRLRLQMLKAYESWNDQT